MNTLTVHEAIAQCRQRGALFVEVDGVLSLELEHRCLEHWPNAERGGYESCIWLETEGVFTANEKVLEGWSGKRVLVFGELEAGPVWPSGVTPDGVQMGFGHFGMYPARIKVRRIERWKDRERARRFEEG